MSMFAELIKEWMSGHPSRSPAALHRLTGVSKPQIGRILKGKTPTIDEALRLGAVLPAGKVLKFMNEHYPCWQIFISKVMSTGNVAA